jgi:hypothetical protein
MKGKTRNFSATLLASVESAFFHSAAYGKPKRPVYLSLAGTGYTMRAIQANLGLGSHLYDERGDPAFEVLKSEKFVSAFQIEPEGTILSLHHPDLFRLDPGFVDPEGIQFLILLPASEHAASDSVSHVKRLFPGVEESDILGLRALAPYFAAYLDRRIRFPLVVDERFYLQLLVASLGEGFASLADSDNLYSRSSDKFGVHPGHGFVAQGLNTMGFESALSFRARHEDFGVFLSEEVRKYFDVGV